MTQAIGKSNLDVRVFENRQLLGLDAAKTIGQKMRQLLEVQSHISMIFAAAPSQNEFLEALSQEEGIDWMRVNAFHLDEYIGLPDGSAQSFGNFLKERIFSKHSFRSIHYINGNAPNLKEECERYAQLLQESTLDIACMGIGENGHIAFNDPAVADFNDDKLVKLVALDQDCRQQQVNDGCFENINEVPIQALTVTIPPLMDVRYIYCIVPGEKKGKAVLNTLYKDVNEMYPSTVLRRHKQVVLFLDRQSSSLLAGA